MKNIFQSGQTYDKPTDKKEDNKPRSRVDETMQKEIQELAYKFYVERGGRHGSDREDWYKAEKIVKQKRTALK